MKCKECKYYHRDSSYKPEKDEGRCECPKFVYYGFSTPDKIFPLGDKLEYWDYESYRAGFFVGSGFGCIHFKRRDNN